MNPPLTCRVKTKRGRLVQRPDSQNDPSLLADPSPEFTMRIFTLLVASLVLSLGCDSKKTETPVTANSDSGSETKTGSDDQKSATSADPNAVLRHAVFFSFKEDVSDEDVQGVADAFAALPSKIPEITEFQWGVNNSKEDKDDGFTHCFLLSFADEAGREVYLPHPAHKEFGSILGGKNDQVFVIDYWGTQSESRPEKELKHAVFFKFKDDAAEADVKKVEEAFAALPEKIESIKGFEWGINNSPERHSHGFTHCFMVTFDSEEGREAYLPHPDHQAFVKVLLPVLDKVRVLDFWDQTKP